MKKIISDKEEIGGKYYEWSIEELMEHVEEVKQKIDPQFHDSIKFEIETYHEMYDPTEHIGFYIKHKRYETDEEEQNREAAEAIRQKQHEAKELSEFARLKSLYG